MKTQCCGYEIDDARPVVMWNPGNGVVQCHNCGSIYGVQELEFKAGQEYAMKLVSEECKKIAKHIIEQEIQHKSK